MSEDNKSQEHTEEEVDEYKAMMEEFDELEGRTPEKKEKESEKETEKDNKPEVDEKAEAESGEEKEEEKEETEKKPDEEKTSKLSEIMVRIDEAVKGLGGKVKETLKGKQEPEKKPEKEEDRLTKEKVKDFLSLIKPEDLPGDMTVGDLEFNLRETAKTEPEIFALISTIVSKSSERSTQAINAIKEEVKELRKWREERELIDAEYEEGEKFWSAVEVVHPNAFKDSKTDEFGEFIVNHKESEKLKKLANSKDPNHGILVLNLYYESIAAEKTKKHDKELSDKKQKIDDTLKDGKPKSKAPESKEDEDLDVLKAVEEELDELEKREGPSVHRI